MLIWLEYRAYEMINLIKDIVEGLLTSGQLVKGMYEWSIRYIFCHTLFSCGKVFEMSIVGEIRPKVLHETSTFRYDQWGGGVGFGGVGGWRGFREVFDTLQTLCVNSRGAKFSKYAQGESLTMFFDDIIL